MPTQITRTLSSLNRGERGRIQSILSKGELARRIRDMGLVPGMAVTVLGHAPMGDPMAFRVADSTVALRRREAATILVSR